MNKCRSGRYSFLVPLLVTVMLGCSRDGADTFHGYIEGEYVHVSCPAPGALTRLQVSRGDVVTSGTVLFELDKNPESTLVLELSARLKQAQARRDDLTKGARTPELASLGARLDQAKAAAALSATNFIRMTELLAQGGVSQSDFDNAQRRMESDRASVQSLTADLETANLGGREDLVLAADADVDAAKALFEKSQWALSQKTQIAPAAGRIEDTLFRVGEFVPAGRPVVSLLPPENIKVRFFVPQARLVHFAPGTTVQVLADGQSAPLTATINFISSQAEFTPPVIYSRENREKLVFMIEAVFSPDVAKTLRPGQPVDVRLPTP